MTAPQTSDPGNETLALRERMTKLEMLYLHLERQWAELNQVALDQGQAIDILQRELKRLRTWQHEAQDEREADREGESDREGEAPAELGAD